MKFGKGKDNPPDSEFFKLPVDEAQPLLLLEYLNSWGNEFLFVFLLIASAFLLLFVNMVPLPETVGTIIGVDVPSYWATHLPIYLLIIAAVVLAAYYNIKRTYIEKMMYGFYQILSETRTKKEEARDNKKK